MMDTGLNIFAIVVLFAWVPAILGLFAMFSARRAVIAAFMIGYLFLPDGDFHFKTLPDVNKTSLTALGVVLGSLIFDGARLFAVRPRLIDLAWLVLCLSPIATSLENGLGIMDGLSSSLNRVFTWGLAYWIGRAYFADWGAIRELAIGLVIAGLAYAPLCWWEIRMSPQLHGQIYGLSFTSFRTDQTLFGFRPNVFLRDGLTVTMFMGMCTLTAFWLWMSGSVRKLFGMPMGWIVLGLLFTTIFCKALGGVVLTLGGMGALALVRWPRTRMAALALVFVTPVYITLRVSGDWSGDRLVDVARFWSNERADSLAFRHKMENLLAAKAMQQPVFGWGGWSRSHVYNEWGGDLTLVDGLWIIMFGEYGLVGMGALLAMVLGSAFLLCWRIPKRSWLDPACGAPIALAMVITLYMIDALVNATFNPVASLMVGAVATVGGVAASTFARLGAFPVILKSNFAAAANGAPPKAVPVPAITIASIKDIPYVYSTHRP